jgi:type IV secretory pathway TrbD component
VARRLEPTVFLAMISPITVGLVAGTVALGRIVTGSWGAAAVLGLAVWLVRVWLSTRVARRLRALPARIDPFALREPWRFFVRDALSARTAFADTVAGTGGGPLRERLEEIGHGIDRSVAACWDVARRGQALTDARRAIDLRALERTLDEHPAGDPRHEAAAAQKASHDRLRTREEQTRERLEVLEAQLQRAVVSAGELATRSGAREDADEIAARVDDVVMELDTLRLALDEIGPAT